MINVIVIDDEQQARDTISLFCEKYTPNVTIIGKASSVDEGAKLINLYKPNIVFLDINMPEKNGFTLFELIDTNSIKIIFTTAYSEYAIKAINLSASYYLLKPIDVSEFKNAIEKTILEIENSDTKNLNIEYLKEILKNKTQFPNKILISTKTGYDLLPIDEIKYLEGDKNYTWIHTINNKYLVAKTLKEYEDVLNSNIFFRTHQSYLVNKNYIQKILNTKPDQLVLNDGTKLNISREKKKYLLQWLGI